MVDSNWAEINIDTLRHVAMGASMESLPAGTSLMTIRVDGIDQAKFRVPRSNILSHLTDSLFRPALHIQGVWCHGFGFHFGISDADAKKDTTTNVETVCRMIEAVFRKCRVLPRTHVLIMDNTSRENNEDHG